MKQLRTENINQPEMADGIFKRVWKNDDQTLDWDRFRMLAVNFTGGRYLDIGAFNSPMPGFLSEEFPDAEIIAIDHAPETVKAMKEKYPKVKYICGDIFAQDFEKNSFDYIVMGEIIEHMEDPQKLVDLAFSLLKKDGWLALSTPFEEEISQPAVSHEHLWAFTLEDIKGLMSKFHNFSIKVEVSGPKVFIAIGQK